MTRLIYVALGSVALAACGDDPVSYSEPVGINLKAKSSDTVNNVVTDDKGINTESGNPYGAFVTNANREIGGDPASIDVEKIALLLGQSTGVTRLGEVFTGKVEILFEMNDTNNSYPVAAGTIAADASGGPLELGASFDSDAVSAVDYEKLLGGSFKVIIRGPAATGFSTKGADADVQVTLTFAAFE